MLCSTKMLCAMLDVSRTWINLHLRHLGFHRPEDGQGIRSREVWYEVDEVIAWIQKYAEISRQTEFIRLDDYAPAAKIRRELKKVDGAGSPKAWDARFGMLLSTILPADTFARTQGLSEKRRGEVPWVPAKYTLIDLWDLQSVRQMMVAWECSSIEMVYREIFKRGMIRIAFEGRTWYVWDPMWASPPPGDMLVRARAKPQ